MKKILALFLAILMVMCTFSSCDILSESTSEFLDEVKGLLNDEDQKEEQKENEHNYIISGDDLIDENGNVIKDVIVFDKDDIIHGGSIVIGGIDKDGNIIKVCSHSDEDKDHICDKCEKELSKCADEDEDHRCDECRKVLSKCIDDDKNHSCDICGSRVNAHVDRSNDKDHLCDYCGREASNCVDVNKDHVCDECGANMGTHSDSANDGDHACDYCGEALGNCADSNSDGKCDECGASTGTGGNVSTETYTRNGNKITFGSYPQSEVTDSSLKSTLNSKAGTLPTSSNSQAWTSYGYYISGNVENFMWYIDIEQDGEKYRGVYFTSYRPYYTTSYSSTGNRYQDDNGYKISTVYWFKYEPISWTILSENTTDGTALILCDMIIDSQEYYITDSGTRMIDGKTVYPNNYAHSTIRKWLNETFYNTAFSELQKQIILTTTVDNSAATTSSSSNQYACENTQDKVFLLSYQDVINSNYGFSSSYSDYDTARQKKTTDYAQAQGAYTNSGNYAGNGRWWLRSPDDDCSYRARGVDYDGYVVIYGNVDCTNCGVVPALQIRL